MKQTSVEHWLFFLLRTYNAQSIAKIIVISFAGIFTADMTRSIVTRPAEGIDAAPIEATVAVKLDEKKTEGHPCIVP